jgi:hypothetical protein
MSSLNVFSREKAQNKWCFLATSSKDVPNYTTTTPPLS